MYDVVIIGAGPGGMSAAVYATRANLKVLILEKSMPGGQMVNIREVENFIGFGQIKGSQLALKMLKHCEDLDIEIAYQKVERVEDAGDVKHIYVEDREDPIESLAVIIAVGSTRRQLKIPGEEEFSERHISWCAICDGYRFKNQRVAVIGGGVSAVDQSIYLSGIAKEVSILTDHDLTAEAMACDYVRTLENVTVYPHKIVTSFAGEDGNFHGVEYFDKDGDQEKKLLVCDGVFEYIGADPATECVRNLDICDEHGYIYVDPRMATRTPGIYAAGDCVLKVLRQVSTACGDGATAAHEVSSYLAGLKKKATPAAHLPHEEKPRVEI